jgi:hypothetical protein
MVLVPEPEEIPHPRPTDATIRELYGHALSCAFDGCHEWLHKPAEGSARPVLNSRVAHIHARRPRGPRWLPGMSSEENRAPENLLLMCIPHSYEIDSDETRFPADLLRRWREAQLQEYLDVRQAWTLNDDQVAEIVRLSFDSPTIAAPVITGIVEAAERAVLRASSTRSGPATAAADWRDLRARTRGMSFGRDSETGERLYDEPSRCGACGALTGEGGAEAGRVEASRGQSRGRSARSRWCASRRTAMVRPRRTAPAVLGGRDRPRQDSRSGCRPGCPQLQVGKSRNRPSIRRSGQLHGNNMDPSIRPVETAPRSPLAGTRQAFAASTDQRRRSRPQPAVYRVRSAGMHRQF